MVLFSYSCLTLCNPMDCSTPCSSILHYFPEFAQIHVHWISESESRSVVSNSLRPHELYNTWNSPDQNTGVGSTLFSRGSSQHQYQNQTTHIAGGFFASWATRKAQVYWSGQPIPFQWIFQTQESNWSLLHCRQILYQLSYQGNPPPHTHIGSVML